MKKIIFIILTAVVLTLSAYASSSFGDNDINVGDLYKNFFNIPGANVFTGSSNALDFESSTALSLFKNTQGYDENLFTYDIVNDPTNSGKGKMMRITLDTEKYLAKYKPESYTYHTITYTFPETINRPCFLMYNTYGKGSIGYWLKGGTTHKHVGTLPATPSWQSVRQNNSDIFSGSVQGLYLQYCVNGKSCDSVQYIDNIVFIPFYKITYVTKYPDGSFAESQETYFLGSTGSISVSNNGTISGLPSSYTPQNTELHFSGYEFLGWSTQENGEEAMANIPLKNKDITLYPVWEKSVQSIPVTLTVYLDAEKTVTQTYNLYAGEQFKLPTYYDLAEYTPKGKFPSGFMIGDKLYAPGTIIYVPENSEISVEAKYEKPKNSEYGDLVLFENFESIAAGTYMYNEKAGINTPTPVSYVNPEWSANKSQFTIQKGDITNHIYVTDDGTGNHVLKLQKVDRSQSNSQFYIFNKGTTPQGLYTLVADFCIPSGQKSSINSFFMRSFYTWSEFYVVYSDTTEMQESEWTTLKITMPIEAGTTCEALTKFQFIMSCNTLYDDSFFYVDNIQLYCNSDFWELKLSDSKTKKLFYTPGKPVTFPYAHEIYEYIPEGFTLSHYTNGTISVKPGEKYIPADSDKGTAFEAVYEKTQYTLKFDLGNINGTIAEIPVKDGETVTLPEFSPHNATLVGWKPYGSDKIYNQQEEFTFVKATEKANLDGVNRLVFTAVYDKVPERKTTFTYNYKITEGMFEGASINELAFIKIAYGAGIIPASQKFNSNSCVTFSDLVKVAERLYYRSQSETTDFSSDESRLSDMVSKGVCCKYENLNDYVTYADMAVILANALPQSFYQEIAFDVKISGLNAGDVGYAEALRLVRAGIIPENTNFKSEITYSNFVCAIAKTVQPSIRETENKRRFYVLGDSLTATKGTIGWPTKLNTLLDGNLEIVNHGIGGINTSTYLNTYDHTGADSLYISALNSIKPGDYVIIALGTNDSTLWSRGTMSYEDSRDNYLKYINQIRAQGGIPVLVCPVGRNNTDASGKYIESDPLIIECMKDVNELYKVNVPIINFKDVSFEILGSMTASERLKIYADNVHYTNYGAEVVAGWFGELVSESSNVQLYGLANHFNKTSFDFNSEDAVYTFDKPVTDNVTSIKITVPAGIRFRANISGAIRSISDDVAEYGFIVARKQHIGDNELTHKSNIPYVSKAAYNNVNHTDLIYSKDSDTDTFVFTGVMTGIPFTKQGLTDILVVRSYIKVGCSYFYGTPHEDSIYETAKRLVDTGNEYIKNIIEKCEQ